MSIQLHFNAFNQIIIDLRALEVKLDDEDEAIIPLCSLPPSLASFRDSFLYHWEEPAKVEEIKLAFLSKEQIDKQLGGGENDNRNSILIV